MRRLWPRPSGRRVVFGLALVAALVAGSAGVVSGQRPAARDASGLELRVLSGQVRTADDSATIVRRARVTVLGTGAAPVFTDQEGRFAVHVPAGAYSVSITKAGFAPQVIQGTAATGEPEPVQVRLARGAAINGLVVDEIGAPVGDVRVAVRSVASSVASRVASSVASRVASSVASRVASSVASRVASSPGGVVRSAALVNAVAHTDDRGQFRVGSLPPGSYQLIVESMPSFQTFVATPPPVTNPGDVRGRGVTTGRPASAVNDAAGAAAPLNAGAGAAGVAAGPASPGAGASVDAAVSARSAGRASGGTAAAGSNANEPTGAPTPAADAPVTPRAARNDARTTARDPDAPPSSVVELGAGSEVEVTISTGRLAADLRAARAFVAEFEAQARALDAFIRFSARPSGSVSGRIRDAFGRSVVGAIVRLTPVSPVPLKITSTDADGFYRFEGLPIGSYRVSASKNGWLPAEYGQERAGQPGTIVTLRDRQRREGVDLHLRSAAVVSGSVTDRDGEVVEGLAVHVWRLDYRGGRPVTESVPRVRRTDDRGRYRIHGLQPGTYYVVASDDRTAQDTVESAMRAPHAFHPGTSTLDLATPVFVDVATDAVGTDIVYTPSPTVRLTGRALNTEQRAPNRGVVLVGSTRSGLPAPAARMATMNGVTFEFPSVSPGEYVIQALHDWGDGLEMLRPTEFTTQVITVGQEDIPGITLYTTPGSTIRGRIVQQGGGRPSVSGDWLQVAVADPDFEPAVTLPRPWTTTINVDLSFQIDGVTGPIRLTSTQDLTPRLWLKSADMGGFNIADDAVVFNRRDETNTYVEVVLAGDGAAVTGRVVDGRNEPVGSYVVIAFPTSKERRYHGSRYIRLARPDEQGRFTMPMLPPGEFWLVAVDALDERLLQNPEFLDGLTARARRMSLSSNHAPSLELPLVRLGR